MTQARARIGPLIVVLLLAAGPLFALEVPALKGRVNDYAQVLTAEQAAGLDNILAGIESSTTAQFALLTIRSLEGEPLEDYSLRVVEAWKLGQKGVDNGLLMLVAVEDRAIRIEVGYGLEGTLPDGKCGTIIRQV
ncbi:MAG: TPM domain-containing protein, partial [Candidatus Aminicenantales bacterium]